jgi:hypothetical protein
MKIRTAIAILACIAFAFGCQNKPAPTTAATADSTTAQSANPVLMDTPASPKPLTADSVEVTRLAAELMQLAANKNYPIIAGYVHPIQGVRFSPYPYIDTTEHKHFTADAFHLQTEENAKQKVFWGTTDPLSEPIKRTVEGYFKEFGYDHDYLQKGKSAFDEALGGSNIIDNSGEVYPGSHFVEYYFGGDDPENEPFQWGSIRLVFQNHEGKYYLVAWIHNAWAT